MQTKQNDVLLWHGMTKNEIDKAEKKILETGKGVAEFLKPYIKKNIERKTKQAENK